MYGSFNVFHHVEMLMITKVSSFTFKVFEAASTCTYTYTSIVNFDETLIFLYLKIQLHKDKRKLLYSA